MKYILILITSCFFFLFSCNKLFEGAGKMITVEEGKHFFKPYEPTWNNDERISYEFTFNESIRHELGDNDQCDWSKLNGYSFHKLTNHKNSIMIAFRYDRGGFVWLSPYYHEDGERFTVNDIYDPGTGQNENVPCTQLTGEVFPYNGTLAIKAQPFETIKIEWYITESPNYTEVTVTNTISNEYFVFNKFWNEDTQHKREINAYYGGNRPAPQRIEILKKKQRF